MVVLPRFRGHLRLDRYSGASVLCEHLLVLCRRAVAEGGVPALQVVDALDVAEDGEARVVAALETLPLHELGLDRRREALRGGVDAPMAVKRPPSSARSALVRPSRRPSSTSAWRTQMRSVPGGMPSCLAVGRMPLWLTRKRQTASCLNSGVCATSTPFWTLSGPLSGCQRERVDSNSIASQRCAFSGISDTDATSMTTLSAEHVVSVAWMNRGAG